jgi:putative sterol carrier protein
MILLYCRNDADFVALAEGKLNGQKAYMSGKLKVKGQIMLAMVRKRELCLVAERLMRPSS